MEALKILIVDDEPPARKKIHSFLAKERGVGVIVEAANGVEAAGLISEGRPDLVFLDIQMPGMNGFEMIEAVGAENMPVVIFVTAYDQYALEAFEVQAVDYLLKPFDQERFHKSFQRAVKQVEARTDNVAVLKRLLAEIGQEKKYLQRIMVNSGSRFFFIKAHEIIYISAEEKYINLHTDKGTHLIRETMSHVEERLDPSKFVRTHRSYLVNIDFIKEMQPCSHGDYLAILKNGAKLPISRRYRERLMGGA
jgi:two-component system LytT family response regulator